jgi:hypothetical protein
LDIIARFSGSDGEYPFTVPAIDPNGDVFGVAEGGHGGGVAYEVTSGGALVVLHKFNNGRAGVNPYASVLLDAAGNIYGVSSGSGTTGKGAIWEIPAPAPAQ